jgi:hypothetical protein
LISQCTICIIAHRSGGEEAATKILSAIQDKPHNFSSKGKKLRAEAEEMRLADKLDDDPAPSTSIKEEHDREEEFVGNAPASVTPKKVIIKSEI